jgi:replicative superfamily II helicase
MGELATFLNAEVYEGTFRPVELQEYVVAGKILE